MAQWLAACEHAVCMLHVRPRARVFFAPEEGCVGQGTGYIGVGTPGLEGDTELKVLLQIHLK